MACVVSLQRAREPTDIQVRRLNAISRKLQSPDYESNRGSRPAQRLRPSTIDRGVEGGIKGHGVRGASLLRRGQAQW
eukprot:4834358-Pyramimonas_sp.AAC.1